MSFSLHPTIIEEAKRLFGPNDVDYVLAKLSSTPLPMARSGPPPRVHLAVIWLSKGDRKSFDYQIDGAACDWRDTLVEAGLGNEDWPQIVRSHGIDCSDWR
jgi:hypothetical protein